MSDIWTVKPLVRLGFVEGLVLGTVRMLSHLHDPSRGSV